MKKLMLSSILAALVALGTAAIPQEYPDEYLGLPGDNLNLYAVMKLFQESETLEGFERNLNAENSRINNLDLNGDNLIDYITVTDYPDGDVHTIVLRVALGPRESQDVAVFTVQKFRNGSVQIQLIGDEALYGKNYIIEPIYEETPNPGYMGRPENRTYVTVVRTTPYEIAAWPLIRFIFMPGYMVWRSSWYWGYYPDWWTPWRPFYWHYYYGYHYHWYNDYYAHYHHWNVCRWNGYNDFYYHGVRAFSPTVVVNINKNVYRTTYSHPEQRKEGEALYTRMNPDRGTRTASQSRESVNSYRQPGNSSRESQGVVREAPRSSATQQRSAPAGRSEAARTQTSTANRQPASESNRQAVSRSGSEQTRSSQSAGSSRTTPSASGRSEYKPAQSSSRSSSVARSSQGSSRSSQSAKSSQGSSRSSSSARSSQSSSRGSSVARSSQGSSRSSSGTRASSSSGQRSSAGRSSSQGRSSSSSSSSSSGRSSNSDSSSRRK